jgi:hypothetical protein
MSLELLGRVHKELSITGSALYETLLAIAERVNRKVQIIRLHWQASMLLERMDRIAGDVGQDVVDRVARRFLVRGEADAGLSAFDAALTRAAGRVQDLKQSLVRIDAQIRALKLEAIHQDLLRLQRDLSLRSAGIERLLVPRGAPAVGQRVRACPRPPSVHIATVLRGPFLLPPGEDLVFRPDDIVVLIGLQADLDRVTAWFTGPTIMSRTVSKSG